MKLLVCLALLLATTHAIPDIFHLQSSAGRYRFASEEAAEEGCQGRGGRLASRDELEAAYHRGLSVCNCGYVKGGTVTFPLRIPETGCGYKAGLQYCPKDYKDWANKGWDAFCTRDISVDCEHQQQFPHRILNFTHLTEGQAVLFPQLQFLTGGQVARWNYYSIRHDVNTYAAVWRHVGYNRYELVGRNLLPSGRAGFSEYVVDDEDRITVQRGDFMGLHYDTYMPGHPTIYSSIPYAKGPDNLCSSSGECVTESDLTQALVVHRHEQQLNHKKHVVINLDSLLEPHATEKLLPALNPTLCPHDPVDPEDKPCQMPFLFKNKTHDSCIEDWSNRAWCSTTDEYDGTNWRFCREGDPFPLERPCHFPFEYKGRNVSACISENAAKPWCSEIPVYNYKKDWHYCRELNATRLGTPVKSVQEAHTACEDEGLLLAMRRDMQSVHDMGDMMCRCGWISEGVAVRVARQESLGCGEGLPGGVHVCPDGKEGYPPICIEP